MGSVVNVIALLILLERVPGRRRPTHGLARIHEWRFVLLLFFETGTVTYGPTERMSVKGLLIISRRIYLKLYLRAKVPIEAVYSQLRNKLSRQIKITELCVREDSQFERLWRLSVECRYPTLGKASLSWHEAIF